MDQLTAINGRFPIRNTAAQKEAFRRYAMETAQQCGYAARAEENDGHTNLVIGDPAQARVIFSAHYDTPRRALLPNLMLPLNPFLRYLYLVGIMLPLLAAAIGAAVLARNCFSLDTAQFGGRLLFVLVYLLVYLGLYVLLFRGRPNRHNANDNTSGTAAVLTLAAKLQGNPAAAFLLFDDEEKGEKGSKAFAAAHPDIRQGTLLVNMDCVGVGDHFLLSVPEAAGQHRAALAALKEAFAAESAVPAEVYPPSRAAMNSDQKSFADLSCLISSS